MSCPSLKIGFWFKFCVDRITSFGRCRHVIEPKPFRMRWQSDGFTWNSRISRWWRQCEGKLGVSSYKTLKSFCKEGFTTFLLNMCKTNLNTAFANQEHTTKIITRNRIVVWEYLETMISFQLAVLIMNNSGSSNSVQRFQHLLSLAKMLLCGFNGRKDLICRRSSVREFRQDYLISGELETTQKPPEIQMSCVQKE